MDKFGERDLNGDGDYLDPGENHLGVDLRPDSDNIYAIADGVVRISKADRFGGLYIDIEHEGGFYSRSLHNRANLVEVGNKVKAGQLIGYVGNTGWSTGRHLHFGLKKRQRLGKPTKLFWKF